MKNQPNYCGHRFPPLIISHAVWLYHRFTLSRDIEDLPVERGVMVPQESIRQWCCKFGPGFARTLKRRQGRLGDTWQLDELFVTIQAQRHYLWRAVDQDGDPIDIRVQRRQDRRAAQRLFRKLLQAQGWVLRRLVTDKLRSYVAAHREVFPSVIHNTDQHQNNRAAVSHQPTPQQERQMRRFKSVEQMQRLLAVHAVALTCPPPNGPADKLE